MAKVPFVTKEQLDEIVKKYPTPFHLYDEKGIRENAKKVKEAFAWNPGFREWLYRLVQEPKRLYKRYFSTNTVFLIACYRLWKQSRKIKRRRMRNRLLIFNRTYDVRSLWIRWKRDHVLF